MFEDAFSFHIRPVIRDNTEPYEILEWYIDSVMQILGGKYNNTFYQFLENNNESFQISLDIELGDFSAAGVFWIKKIRKSYRMWMEYVLNGMMEIGVPTIWDYAHSLEEELCCEFHWDEPQRDWYDSDEDFNTHMEYLQDQLNEFQNGKKEVLNTSMSFSHNRPERLLKPRNEKEQLIFDCIKLGLETIELFKSKELTLQSFNCIETINNGGLGVEAQYIIIDKWWKNHIHPWSEHYVFEQAIDERANVGISPWSTKNLSKKFDEDEFDHTPMLLIHEFFNLMLKIEQLWTH